MGKPVVALDIDDTLFDHFADIALWYNATFGTKLTLANNHPNKESDLQHWGVSTVEEAVRRVHAFYETPEFIGAQPYQSALRVLPLVSNYYDIVVVTARDIDILEQFTHQWLNEHFAGLYREVHFTGQYNLTGKMRTKQEVLRLIGANYLIDDSLVNCLQAVEMGATGLLFGDYPWNQTERIPDGVIRVQDWDAVEVYFESGI
ncbi:MAG: hypothetical protein WAU02_04570 [Candidatus Saccharimonadales bacterium]